MVCSLRLSLRLENWSGHKKDNLAKGRLIYRWLEWDGWFKDYQSGCERRIVNRVFFNYVRKFLKTLHFIVRVRERDSKIVILALRTWWMMPFTLYTLFLGHIQKSSTHGEGFGQRRISTDYTGLITEWAERGRCRQRRFYSMYSPIQHCKGCLVIVYCSLNWIRTIN